MGAIFYTIYSFLISGLFFYLAINNERYIDKVVFFGFFILFLAISIRLLFKLKKNKIFCKDGFLYIDSKKYPLKQVKFIGRTLEIKNKKFDIDSNEKFDELKFCFNDIKFGYFGDYVIIKNEKYVLKDIKDVDYEFELVDGKIYINAKIKTDNKTITFTLKSLFLQKHFIKFLKAYENVDFEYKYELKFSYIDSIFIIGIILLFFKEPFSIIGIWLAFFGAIRLLGKIKNYFYIQNYLKKLKEVL